MNDPEDNHQLFGGCQCAESDTTWCGETTVFGPEGENIYVYPAERDPKTGRVLLEEHELEMCPGAMAHLPSAVEATQAWRWWSKSQLELLYPRGVPVVIVAAINWADVVQARWEREGARLRELASEERWKHRT